MIPSLLSTKVTTPSIARHLGCGLRLAGSLAFNLLNRMYAMNLLLISLQRVSEDPEVRL